MKYTSKYEAPWASAEKIMAMNTGSWRYQQPVTKVSKCCHCGTCYLLCPVGCIKDKGAYYAVDLEYCKGCGICARFCPVKAIALVREL